MWASRVGLYVGEHGALDGEGTLLPPPLLAHDVATAPFIRQAHFLFGLERPEPAEPPATRGPGHGRHPARLVRPSVQYCLGPKPPAARRTTHGRSAALAPPQEWSSHPCEPEGVRGSPGQQHRTCTLPCLDTPGLKDGRELGREGGRGDVGRGRSRASASVELPTPLHIHRAPCTRRAERG